MNLRFLPHLTSCRLNKNRYDELSSSEIVSCEASSSNSSSGHWIVALLACLESARLAALGFGPAGGGGGVRSLAALDLPRSSITLDRSSSNDSAISVLDGCVCLCHCAALRETSTSGDLPRFGLAARS